MQCWQLWRTKRSEKFEPWPLCGRSAVKAAAHNGCHYPETGLFADLTEHSLQHRCRAHKGTADFLCCRRRTMITGIARVICGYQYSIHAALVIDWLAPRLHSLVPAHFHEISQSRIFFKIASKCIWDSYQLDGWSSSFFFMAGVVRESWWGLNSFVLSTILSSRTPGWWSELYNLALRFDYLDFIILLLNTQDFFQTGLVCQDVFATNMKV